jgi:streptogramin lyase
MVVAGCTLVPSAGPTTASPRAPTPSAAVQLAGFPANAAADSTGLWVADYKHGDLVHIYGASKLQLHRIPIGNPTALEPDCSPENESDPIGSWLQRRCDLPSGVAVGSGSVWVGRNDQRAVMRLDPATERIQATIPVGLRVFNIAASESAVWIVSFEDNAIARIDPATNTVTFRQQLLHAPSGVLIADGSAWITTAGDGTVVRVDAQTGAWQASVPVGGQPLPVADAPEAIWVRCEQPNTLVRIDPSTNAVVATVPVDVFYGEDGLDSLVAKPAGVWATGLELQWIDSGTNRVTRRLPVEGRPYDAGAGALWVVGLEGRVSRIYP